MWCWAASGQMVMEHYSVLKTQCDQACDMFPPQDCCGNPTPEPCVKGGWPDFSRYGFKISRTHDQPLTWDDLKKELTAGRPVACSWHWLGGGGHMMVVSGFAELGGKRYVSILDPWPPELGDERDITYEEYERGSDHYHWDDFYGVELMQK